MLQGKRFILGITGSIAAYKAAILVRNLIKKGAEVKVVMTPLAKEFITPLTLATLSKNPILIDFFNPENGDWNSHVDLGLWADGMIIAPATANTMAKMVTGVADNLLLTTYLSARCPVFVAPAMDLDMFSHPATQQNVSVLIQRGVHVIEATTGELASGLEGKGRMQEPEKIVGYLEAFYAVSGSFAFKGKKALITAGPTYEAIDPVRYIGNHSSGKMGYALATALVKQGADVILVSGPVSGVETPLGVTLINVTTAEEMLSACKKAFKSVDLAIMAAAVSDYRPVEKHDNKIKRGKQETLSLQLVSNPDIAKTLGGEKKNHQFLVGFALETEDEISNAQKKRKAKNLDMIVLNSLKDAGAGFGTNTNKITIIDSDNKTVSFELKSKNEVANDIVNAIAKKMKLL